MGLPDNGAPGGQKIDAPAAVRRVARFPQRIIGCAGFIGMDGARTDTLGDLSGTNHLAAVIIYLDQIVLFDSPVFGISGVDPWC